MSDEAQQAWDQAAGYTLPEPSGVECCFTWTAYGIADVVGMFFRVETVDRVDYPGHIQDAAVTLWLAQLKPGVIMQAAIRASRQDPEWIVETALKWWEDLFAANHWDPLGDEYLECLRIFEEMWCHITRSKTLPVTETHGGDDPPGAGKQ